MRALHATVIGLLASSIAGAGLGCRPSPRASRPPDGGALVTVYVPARMADQVMGRLQAGPARHPGAPSVPPHSPAPPHPHPPIAHRPGRPGAPVPSGPGAGGPAGNTAEGAPPRRSTGV